MRFPFLLLPLFLFFTACGDKPTQGESMSLVGHDLVAIPGSDIQQAYFKDAKGRILEQGTVRNGKKHGTWVVYHNDHDFLKSIASYVDGVLNGPYFEFGSYGQNSLSSNYLNGQLHGQYIKYKSIRKAEEGNYTNGQLDGIYKKYYDGTEIVQQEISYKNGKQDGEHLFYDQKGVVSMRYSYKDGEKVSGGVVAASK